jgi:hypothetical protein
LQMIVPYMQQRDPGGKIFESKSRMFVRWD